MKSGITLALNIIVSNVEFKDYVGNYTWKLEMAAAIWGVKKVCAVFGLGDSHYLLWPEKWHEVIFRPRVSSSWLSACFNKPSRQQAQDCFNNFILSDESDTRQRWDSGECVWSVLRIWMIYEQFRDESSKQVSMVTKGCPKQLNIKGAPREIRPLTEVRLLLSFVNGQKQRHDQHAHATNDTKSCHPSNTSMCQPHAQPSI